MADPRYRVLGLVRVHVQLAAQFHKPPDKILEIPIPLLESLPVFGYLRRIASKRIVSEPEDRGVRNVVEEGGIAVEKLQIVGQKLRRLRINAFPGGFKGGLNRHIIFNQEPDDLVNPAAVCARFHKRPVPYIGMALFPRVLDPGPLCRIINDGFGNPGAVLGFQNPQRHGLHHVEVAVADCGKPPPPGLSRHHPNHFKRGFPPKFDHVHSLIDPCPDLKQILFGLAAGEPHGAHRSLPSPECVRPVDRCGAGKDPRTANFPHRHRFLLSQRPLHHIR